VFFRPDVDWAFVCVASLGGLIVSFFVLWLLRKIVGKERRRWLYVAGLMLSLAGMVPAVYFGNEVSSGTRNKDSLISLAVVLGADAVYFAMLVFTGDDYATGIPDLCRCGRVRRPPQASSAGAGDDSGPSESRRRRRRERAEAAAQPPPAYGSDEANNAAEAAENMGYDRDTEVGAASESSDSENGEGDKWESPPSYDAAVTPPDSMSLQMPPSPSPASIEEGIGQNCR